MRSRAAAFLFILFSLAIGIAGIAAALPFISDTARPPVDAAHAPVGCERCQQTGYVGRMVLAELLLTQPTELGRAILSRDDASRLEQLARDSGLVPLADQAIAAVQAGLTSPREVRRVLGGAIRTSPAPD